MAKALEAIPKDHAELNHIPFLPYKPEEGPQAKTYRISFKLCLLQKNDGLCSQSLAERSFWSVYCLCELNFAASLGYLILELDEALIYVEQKKFFSSLFKLCASYKICYNEVPQVYQNQKHRYCQEINEAMGFDEDFERLSPDLLFPNPSETRTKRIHSEIASLGLLLSLDYH